MKPIVWESRVKLEDIFLSHDKEEGSRFKIAFKVKDFPLPLCPMSAVEFFIEKFISTNFVLSALISSFWISTALDIFKLEPHPSLLEYLNS